MSAKVQNEIIKWVTSVLTALGISALILSVVRPMVMNTDSINAQIAFVAILPLAAAVWNLTNLRPENG